MSEVLERPHELGVLAYQLEARRLDEREAFAIALRSPVLLDALQDDSVFHSMIQLAVVEYGVDRADLVRLGLGSESSISRWANGASCPAIFLRPSIATAVADSIERDVALKRQEIQLSQAA